ncbi:hypothetical protein BKA82DRAFT_3978942 [Pisolithus tinctorius]|nr:hypothetical protein BKA82DRAFT_3994173 [Pisolithus tinctorius]KAI6142332.1 hypothetical protein BKA82DRAFT_3985083 [Pisolithus tinctorius]KAI6146062.1 hypothetical protein BKA82DRAFT_3981369 [Pisolithus tinctorius]KAI6148153.1 hypothetical protein BKA82DRAFT_3978942 [Pisolithus tinctorius]
MCLCCRRSLSSPKPRQPKDAIANFQYYGVSELPVDVKSALACASQFELQLIALARATVITHHYQTKGARGGRLPEEASQRFNRGNVAILPQDPGALRTVLPPTTAEIEGAMCVVFAGGSYRPTLDALCKFPPVLVNKSRVQLLIEWLIAHNMWYKANGVTFSQDILESLHMIQSLVVLKVGHPTCTFRPETGTNRHWPVVPRVG